MNLNENASWIQEQAQKILAWANELSTRTWPRNDYKEMLHLTIMYLGGNVPNFTFKCPGPDHHARWMSKAIYFLKLALLSEKFHMKEKEKEEVRVMAEFVALFYVPSFLQSELGSRAPCNDLELIKNMKIYSRYNPEVAATCLESYNRHLWYLTHQLVVFALADANVAENTRQKMAVKLHGIERKSIDGGRPKFPDITNIEDIALENFIAAESWLLFDLLGLSGPQNWLQTSPDTWHEIPEYLALSEFIENVSVTNDIAERGVKLMTDFIEKCHDEEQRDAITQVIEEHRKMYPMYCKDILSLL